MNTRSLRGRAALAAAVVGGAAALLPATASAHARISPPVSVAGKLQLYSLAVPTEKEGLTTSAIVMTVPAGFGIDSFVPPPAGWQMHLQQTGSGDSAVVTKVTWTGGRTPTGQDSLFEFLAQPASAKTYKFHGRADLLGRLDRQLVRIRVIDAPAPTIEAAGSLGGGGVSVLTIIALVVGVLGLIAGIFALSSGSKGRALA